MSYLAKAAAILLAVSPSATLAREADAQPTRPNVVVIVADDLGFSDLGAFGGEIRTPNLDALAKAGLRLANFHSAPTCSPTRSMLLSGTDNHTAGVGAMAEMRTMTGNASEPAPWGYEGVITRRVATLAERLHNGGYYTIFSGKWHLGLKPAENPAARGFDSSFALLQGGNNHFGGGFGPESNPNLRATFTEDGKEVGIPEHFYSSDYYTSKLITQIDGRPQGKPFFAYLAFTAPHSPLQAPPEDIARYKGRYDEGWAVLRQQRLARMKSLGIVPADIIPAEIPGYAEAWSRLTPQQKKVEARKMEILAAMVDRLDQNVGRLVDHLKRSGQFDNTIFLFTSDNGPAAEGAETYGRLPGMAEFIASRDSSYEAMGTKASIPFLGPNWAQAASAPYRLYKGVITEGGTRVAAFVTFPGAARQHMIGTAYASVMDVTPTLLETASIAAEPIVDGREVAPIRGRSMLPYLMEASAQVHPDDEPIAFELHGHRAVRQGEWKLVLLPAPIGDGKWALYNLARDPAEQHDLSAQFPGRKRALLDAWQSFADETRITP
ncbi:MAG: arylsulfatase [Novosphingobium sp.]